MHNFYLITGDTGSTTEGLAEACSAFKRKIEKSKKGNHQYGWLLRTDPFKLYASQKLLLAAPYRVANNGGRPVDNERMSRNIHFKTLNGNTPALWSLEKQIL
ncbi:hypothetical protein F441_13930 [Phytophthora nicotianae CJ01A1]|uniref:Uncharacterized protein n=5 Tax=Phytophthora nicotianae TaxID=4792 RepID=W2PVN3_PHYN3|nr:hypothetical protein PPTG_23522 [Phytophthora nicotianae INRA-310]ETL34199.1 hypothetical protein L916_13536 [Phytophthora nicotianae]ETO69374.1 hypothetical protein F444_14033 [Phytophthora nicotianae P1976]ETP10441.1 hypothetical protein F441_13930 [Phytophthora nicotianae CJ01A1]ETM40704.1 hypothetical protein L914_13437 [Phytophthora nicotianae]ETN04977.1 hypothetical protein PPTG_23522 [Phytophthora nicotianae INRA-310]